MTVLIFVNVIYIFFFKKVDDVIKSAKIWLMSESDDIKREEITQKQKCSLTQLNKSISSENHFMDEQSIHQCVLILCQTLGTPLLKSIFKSLLIRNCVWNTLYHRIRLRNFRLSFYFVYYVMEAYSKIEVLILDRTYLQYIKELIGVQAMYFAATFLWGSVVTWQVA